MEKLQPVDIELFFVAGRNDAVVVRKFSIHHFRYQDDAGKGEAYLVLEDLDGNRLVTVFQQPSEFQHHLTRQNDFFPFLLDLEGQKGECEPMAIGGHHFQLCILDHQKQPVQVIPDVLLCHRVLNQGQKMPERFLREGYLSLWLVVFRKLGKIFRRQGLQVETAFSCLDMQPVVGGFQYHAGGVGQRAQNVLKFFGCDRN